VVRILQVVVTELPEAVVQEVVLTVKHHLAMALQVAVAQVVTQAMAVTVEMITTLGVTMVLAVEAAAEVLHDTLTVQ
jgi:hypothetical protein